MRLSNRNKRVRKLIHQWENNHLIQHSFCIAMTKEDHVIDCSQPEFWTHCLSNVSECYLSLTIIFKEVA